MSFVRRYSEFPIIPVANLSATEDYVIFFRSNGAVPIADRNARGLLQAVSPWKRTGTLIEQRTANDTVKIVTAIGVINQAPLGTLLIGHGDVTPRGVVHIASTNLAVPDTIKTNADTLVLSIL